VCVARFLRVMAMCSCVLDHTPRPLLIFRNCAHATSIPREDPDLETTAGLWWLVKMQVAHVHRI